MAFCFLFNKLSLSLVLFLLTWCFSDSSIFRESIYQGKKVNPIHGTTEWIMNETITQCCSNKTLAHFQFYSDLFTIYIHTSRTSYAYAYRNNKHTTFWENIYVRCELNVKEQHIKRCLTAIYIFLGIFSLIIKLMHV